MPVRKRIRREVEGVTQRPGGCGEGSDGPGTLHAEPPDHMDAPDLDGNLASCSTAGIIEEICRGLGLDARPGARSFKRRTPADIAQLCARAAPTAACQPGAGLQGPGPQDLTRGAAQSNPGSQPDKRAADLAAISRT